MKNILTLIVFLCISYVHGQDLTVQVNTEEIILIPGETFQLEAFLLDAEGKKIKDGELNFYTANGKYAESNEEGLVTAYEPGNARVIIIGRMSEDEGYGRADIPVTINFAGASSITLESIPTVIFTGQSMQLTASVIDSKGFEITGANPKFLSKNDKAIQIDQFGMLSALEPGKSILEASIQDISVETEITVKENPVVRAELVAEKNEIVTGEVIRFKTAAFDAKGNSTTEVTPSFAFSGKSADPSDYASGIIRPDGRFVADVPGTYTITVAFGGVTAQKTVRASAREVTEKVQLIGQGSVSNVHTSDLWVWEGSDGRDYCVTGTWGGNGEAYFWDVTDPENMILVDTVTVDARTVNDVKVSEDGNICILTREGASNRKNGIVILDVSNPRDTKIISTFTEGLTGGVHNLFIYQNHVYALSNGERYDIINIEDPKNPKKVGVFELEGPGHSIHDVWIEDGIAYSSNWDYGVFMVDVGNGVAGGSPSNPKIISSYAYPSGWNHAAFPYTDKETGKFYVIAGDEAFPNGLSIDDNPTIPAGYLHFIDFTDKDNPVEVAKYEVPGAGSHNFWVDGDLLYVANYNAGLRVVDLSGDLMGDLFRQGREIAWYLPSDPKGRISNAPMTWGPQPHKGHVFFSDWNSGLWSVKVPVKKPENVTVESK